MCRWFIGDLRCVINFQSDWATLQQKFSRLNPLQLYTVLTKYDCGSGKSPPDTWLPPQLPVGADWSVMENFDYHPRLTLPSEGLHLDLTRDVNDATFAHALSRLQLQFARAGQ